ncbi:MAG: DeoR/GlpR transcriptional regulator [Lentisphaeria bacterium]|nr:DeoR/GlpR transcriptional regulator [Lentisphaeria bacterium]
MVRKGNSRKLLSTEREALILRCIAEGIKTVGGLVEELNVSEATVRRDLENLEQQGLLRRVHGGAELVKNPKTEPVFAEKTGLRADEKARIAHLAEQCINDGDTIFLDGGSTVLELARLLSDKKGLTIVTNSLMAASELMETECRLIIVGGEFRPLSRTLVGPLTGNTLKSLHIDKAFLGTMGLTLEQGLTTTDVNEAYTKHLAAEVSDEVYVLADSSKIGTNQFVTCDPVSAIDYLITDAGISQDMIKQLKKEKVEVIV